MVYTSLGASAGQPAHLHPTDQRNLHPAGGGGEPLFSRIDLFLFQATSSRAFWTLLCNSERRAESTATKDREPAWPSAALGGRGSATRRSVTGGQSVAVLNELLFFLLSLLLLPPSLSLSSSLTRFVGYMSPA